MIEKKLSWFQMDLLVQWFQHHATQEQRHKLMREMPEAYNAMCGSQIVLVVLVKSGSAPDGRVL